MPNENLSLQIDANELLVISNEWVCESQMTKHMQDRTDLWGNIATVIIEGFNNWKLLTAGRLVFE